MTLRKQRDREGILTEARFQSNKNEHNIICKGLPAVPGGPLMYKTKVLGNEQQNDNKAISAANFGAWSVPTL